METGRSKIEDRKSKIKLTGGAYLKNDLCNARSQFLVFLESFFGALCRSGLESGILNLGFRPQATPRHPWKAAFFLLSSFCFLVSALVV
jgi:hypothetical protein